MNFMEYFDECYGLILRNVTESWMLCMRVKMGVEITGLSKTKLLDYQRLHEVFMYIMALWSKDNIEL